ncbi:hypothetical protein SAMN02744775_00691 [Enterobacter sp. CC120223-11]|nr:hypothetical protein SAMN02744775_00691 [Enterobacter sp. CC120223-11]
MELSNSLSQREKIRERGITDAPKTKASNSEAFVAMEIISYRSCLLPSPRPLPKGEGENTKGLLREKALQFT